MGLRRKKQVVEGWSDSSAEVGRLTRLKEGIRDSNRAWFVVMIGVVLIGICLLVVIAKNEQLLKVTVPEPPHNIYGVYDDDAHRGFVREFNTAMGRRDIRTKLTFVNSGEVKIVVPVDTTEDDVVYVSSTAARAVLRRFHTAPYVYVYTRDNSDPPREKQLAVTKWLSRQNDFVVLMTRPQGGGQ